MKRDTCDHPEFQAYTVVHRILDVMPMRFVLDIHVRCAVCLVRFQFSGVDMGLMPDRPMCSPDQFELRAPIEPNAHVTSLMASDPECAWPGGGR